MPDEFQQGRQYNITNLSRAYRLEPGTGWYVPPGVLHAPGRALSIIVCTFNERAIRDNSWKMDSLFTFHQGQDETIYRTGIFKSSDGMGS